MALADIPSFVNYTAGGSTPIGVLQHDDIVSGDTGVRFEEIHQVGFPLKLQQICFNETTLQDYPYDGNGTITAYTSGTPSITINASINASLDPTGMLIVLTNGPANGDVRRVISWNSGTRVATINRTLSGAAVNGNTFKFLVDTYKLNQIIMKPEFSSSANTTTMTISVIMYDMPRSPDGAVRTSRRFEDQEVTIVHQGHNTDASAGYHGSVYSVITRGALGCKIRLKAISAGNAYLWAAGA